MKVLIFGGKRVALITRLRCLSADKTPGLFASSHGCFHQQRLLLCPDLFYIDIALMCKHIFFSVLLILQINRVSYVSDI